MKRVLIVDDAIDLGRLLQDALKVTRPDIPITVVPSAEEALLEASRFSYDLLVTDLRLPGMSGLELIRKIRVRQPAIKVIVITALSPEDRLFRQTEEVILDVFIRKPISVAAFLDSVDRLIGTGPQPAVEILPQVEAEQAQQRTQPAEPASQVENLAAQENEIREEISPAAENIQAGTQLPPPDTEVPEKYQPAVPEPAQQLPEMPPVQVAPPREGAGLVLDRLRATLGADAILIVDEQGNSVAQSGVAPDPLLVEQLVPAAIASLSAGVAVSYLLGTASEGSVQAFRATEMDFILAPLASSSLLVLLKSGRSVLRLAIAVEEVLAAQAELSSLLAGENGEEESAVGAILSPEPLERSGVTKSLSADDIDADLEKTLLDLDPDLQKLETLLAENKILESQPEEPDQFWEAAAGNESKGFDHPGSLSYDQAQELGLIKPDDEV